MRYYPFIPLTFLQAVFYLASSHATNTCVNTQERCIKRIGCSMALNNINIACSAMRLGTVKGCTDSCMRAIVSLVTVEDNLGIDYLTCDCQGNIDCDEYRTKISMCSSGVLSALETLDNEQVISCNLARMLCEAETSCYTSLANYEQDCWQLWSAASIEYSCSTQCKASVDLLHLERRAKKLTNCQCDDSDPIISQETCMKMRNNTDIYCLNKPPQIYKPTPEKIIQIPEKQPDNLITAAVVSATENNAAQGIVPLQYVILCGLLVWMLAGTR